MSLPEPGPGVVPATVFMTTRDESADSNPTDNNPAGNNVASLLLFTDRRPDNNDGVASLLGGLFQNGARGGRGAQMAAFMIAEAFRLFPW